MVCPLHLRRSPTTIWSSTTPACGCRAIERCTSIAMNCGTTTSITTRRRDRLKLRYRTYLNSDPEITYFELKRNDRGRTVKERRRSRPVDGALWSHDARVL